MGIGLALTHKIASAEITGQRLNMNIVHISLQNINNGTLRCFSCGIWFHVTVFIIKVNEIDTCCRPAVSSTQIYVEFQSTSKVIRLENCVSHGITLTLMDKSMVIQSQTKLITGSLDVCCPKTLHVEFFVDFILVSVFCFTFEHLEIDNRIFCVA